MPYRAFPSRPPSGSSSSSSRASGPLFGPAAAQDTYTANIDGGARGNPGPSGYGVVIKDPKGTRVAELSEYLGKQTNNFAEYSGLLAALDYAVTNDLKNLQVVSDSELMVKQMLGVYKVSNPVLQELHARAKKLANRLDSLTIRHVLRAQNKEADALANAAMDRGIGRGQTVVARDSATAAPVKRGAAPEMEHELEGIVRDGVIEFEGDLPDGTRVKIRVME